MKKNNKKSDKLGPNFGWEYGGSTGYVGRKISPRHQVAIMSVEEEGKVLKTLPAYGYESDWDHLKKQYPYTTERPISGEVITTVAVPSSESYIVKVSTASKKTALMCVYNSVEEYCSRMLGIKLGNEDRDFFIDHPLVDADGVSFSNTLRVVQELIDPYGLRISKVRLAPGQALKGDIQQWRGVLGINPIALTDRNTTNAEFWGDKPVTQNYNFEYNAAPLSPSISCGVMNPQAGVTGSSGGHATFIPPRKYASGAMLQFQIGRADQVHWRKPPVFEPFTQEEEKYVECFDLDEWFRKDRVWGADLDKLRIEKGLDKPKKEEKTEVETGFRAPKRYLGTHHKTLKDCYNCNRHQKDLKFTFGVPGICDGCWSNLMNHIMCDTCSHVGNTPGNPEFRFINFERGAQRIMVQCNAGCHRIYHLDHDNKKYGKAVKKMLESLYDYQLDCLIEKGRETVNVSKLPDPADSQPQEGEPKADVTNAQGAGEPLM